MGKRPEALQEKSGSATQWAKDSKHAENSKPSKSRTFAVANSVTPTGLQGFCEAHIENVPAGEVSCLAMGQTSGITSAESIDCHLGWPDAKVGTPPRPGGAVERLERGFFHFSRAR
jgi:hypothetical protein